MEPEDFEFTHGKNINDVLASDHCAPIAAMLCMSIIRQALHFDGIEWDAVCELAKQIDR